MTFANDYRARIFAEPSQFRMHFPDRLGHLHGRALGACRRRHARDSDRRALRALHPMDTVISAPSRWAVQIAARLTKDQHRTKPVDLPAGCRQCGPCGCALLAWAERVYIA